MQRQHWLETLFKRINVCATATLWKQNYFCNWFWGYWGLRWRSFWSTGWLERSIKFEKLDHKIESRLRSGFFDYQSFRIIWILRIISSMHSFSTISRFVREKNFHFYWYGPLNFSICWTHCFQKILILLCLNFHTGSCCYYQILNRLCASDGICGSKIKLDNGSPSLFRWLSLYL